MADLYSVLNSFPYNIGREDREKLNAKNSNPKPEIVDRRLLFRLNRAKLIDEALASVDGNITLEHAKALAHWSLFGRESAPSPTRVRAQDWNTREFKKPVRFEWRLPVPAFQLGRLLNGFCPETMEDKWLVYADGPDFDGTIKLHLHRSWTGNKQIELEIQCTGDKEEELESWKAQILAISWETTEELVKDHSEEMAKYQALECCNWCLGVMLANEIAEPSGWKNLPTYLPKMGETKTTYRGAHTSEEVLQSFTEGDIITFD